jgi:hypothetical protein
MLEALRLNRDGAASGRGALILATRDPRPMDKKNLDKTRQNLKWHLFIYYVLNGYSLFPFQEALVPGSQYLFIFVSSVAT